MSSAATIRKNISAPGALRSPGTAVAHSLRTISSRSARSNRRRSITRCRLLRREPLRIPGYDASGKPAEHTWTPIDLPLEQRRVQRPRAHAHLGSERQLHDQVADRLSRARRRHLPELRGGVQHARESVLATDFVTFDTLDTEQFTQELQFLGSFGERVDYLRRPLLLQGGRRSLPAHRHRHSGSLYPSSVRSDRHRQGPRYRRRVGVEGGVRAGDLDAGDPGRPAGADVRRPLHGGQSQGDPHDAQHLPVPGFVDSHRCRARPLRCSAGWQQHRRGLQQVQSGLHREHGVDDGCEHLSAHRHRLQGRRHFGGRRGRNFQFRLRLRA